MPSFVSFKRGETIALVLQCTMGDALSVSSINAEVRATAGWNTVDPASPVAAQAAVTFYPASDQSPAYWGIVIAAADSYGLAAGRYAIDAELMIGGASIYADMLVLAITEPVTVPTAPTLRGLGSPWINPSPDTGDGVLTLQWVIPPCSNTLPATAAVIGLPSPNLVAELAALTSRVAALEAAVGANTAPAPGTEDFSQNGNPLADGEL